MDRATFLVTGGSGCQGSAIIRLLLERYPQSSIYSASRRPVKEYDRITYIQADLRTEVGVHKVLDEAKPDVIFHSAGDMSAPGAGKVMTDDELWDSLYTMTERLVDYAKKKGAKAFVFTSSSAVIGYPNIDGGDETWPMRGEERKVPFYPYAKAEKFVLAADARGGLRTTSIRPAVVYGHADKLLFGKLNTVLLAGQAQTELGHGETSRVSCTHAVNSAHAHLLAAERLLVTPEGVASEAFFVNDGEPVMFHLWLRKIWTRMAQAQGIPYDSGKVHIIEDVTGPEAKEWIAKNMGEMFAAMMTGPRWYKTDRISRELGYKPVYDADTALEQAVQAFLADLRGERGKAT